MLTQFLNGKHLYLRSLLESDIEGPYVTWFNDEEVCKGNSHHVFPYTPEEALKYVRYANQAHDALILAMVLFDDNRHIGNIALQNIHSTYHAAEFSILIGDKSSWGKGYSKEAGRLLFDHGFGALNLNRIYCGTFDNNIAMKRLAVYLGMKEEGRRRQAAFKDGHYVDVIEYGVLKKEYEEHWQNKERKERE